MLQYANEDFSNYSRVYEVHESNSSFVGPPPILILKYNITIIYRLKIYIWDFKVYPQTAGNLLSYDIINYMY